MKRSFVNKTGDPITRNVFILVKTTRYTVRSDRTIFRGIKKRVTIKFNWTESGPRDRRLTQHFQRFAGHGDKTKLSDFWKFRGEVIKQTARSRELWFLTLVGSVFLSCFYNLQFIKLNWAWWVAVENAKPNYRYFLLYSHAQVTRKREKFAEFWIDNKLINKRVFANKA